MSHYDAVVWETGADLYTREPTQPGGTGVSKLLDDEVLAMREYMNAGGKVLVAGKEPLQGVRDQFLYNPDQGRRGRRGASPTRRPARTTRTTRSASSTTASRSPTTSRKYWLGAYIPAGAALTEQLREDPAVGDTAFNLNGPGSVSNAPLLQSFLTTTSLIPDYPEFAAGTEFAWTARSRSTASRRSTRRPATGTCRPARRTSATSA